MGAVYEARHTGTGRRVAVKVITADLTKSPGLVARFEVEARAGGTIDSQHIAQVLDTGHHTDGAPYIVMEYLVGEDLYQLIARIAPVPVELAMRIVAQACLGLEKAHQAKIIHRDIKPANIFLNQREGDELSIKILDFGVAKIRADEGQNITALTRTGSLLGSPLYMSPEQARGDKNIDHRSDLWSLGVVLYEQLCGRTPFHEIEALGSLIIAICGEPAPPIQRMAPWVPPQVATIVHKALTHRPDERFQSAHEMFRALKAVLPGGSSAIERSMLVPMTSDQRAYVAPAMTSGEPVLSSSGPGAYDEQGGSRGPSVSQPDISNAPPAARGSMPDPAEVRAPISPANAAASPQTPGAGERARTTAGVTSEPARPAAPRSKVPLAIGAVAALGVAVFVGTRMAGSSAPANAVPPPPTATTPTTTDNPAPPPPPSAPAAASASAPVVAPDEPAATDAAKPAVADAGASPPPRPGATKGPLPRTAAPAPAPATTSVGGRIIRTDLP
jgi:serine/threonine-protein kinase